MGGWYITTIEPHTYLGPVVDFAETEEFSTIKVDGYWINVWAKRRHGNGVDFAFLVDPGEVRQWHMQGWEDRYLASAG